MEATAARRITKIKTQTVTLRTTELSLGGIALEQVGGEGWMNTPTGPFDDVT